MTMKIEAGQVIANLNAAVGDILKAGRQGLLVAGEHVLGVSNAQVPLEEGDLARSGGVSQDGDGRTAISYDTPYAVRQHEDLTLRHDAGRNAKFLEKAIAAERDMAARLVQVAIRRATGG